MSAPTPWRCCGARLGEVDAYLNELTDVRERLRGQLAEAIEQREEQCPKIR